MRLMASAVAAGLVADWSIAAEDAFHITFGTTGDPNGRNADSVTFVAQTDSGDIVVPGQGASRWSDDGIGNHTVPFIARTQVGGNLRWQHVYGELQNQLITALISRGEEQYVLLEQPEPDSLVKRVSLRRIDRRGTPSDEIGALEGLWVEWTIPVVDGDLSYFLLSTKRGSTSKEAYAADVQLLQFDLKGRIADLSIPAGIQSIDHFLRLGQQEFLIVPRWQGTKVFIEDPETYQFRLDFIRINGTGKSELLFTLVNKQCHRVAASTNRIYCAEYAPFRNENEAIVAYSLGGAELWRHDLGPAPMDPVRQILPLDSGGLVYSFRDVKDAIVVELSPQGSQAWSQTVRSTGQYTFVSAIESLEDGRLAFLGSTGPWNGFVSTDTDAMLLVTNQSGNGLRFPQIVSTVTSVR